MRSETDDAVPFASVEASLVSSPHSVSADSGAGIASMQRISEPADDCEGEELHCDDGNGDDDDTGLRTSKP